MSSSRPQDRVLVSARDSSRDAEPMSIARASSPARYLSGPLCEPSRSFSPPASGGRNIGPRVHDTDLNEFVFDELILQVHAGAFSFEAANPRHEHEWQVWEKVKLPAGAVLIPGVISNSTVLVEHPELVAQRICRFAKMVGRENVIAGSDCGFANFANSREIHPSIVWAKLQALAEGARIASKKLFSSPTSRTRPPKGHAGQGRRRPRTARAAITPS